MALAITQNTVSAYGLLVNSSTLGDYVEHALFAFGMGEKDFLAWLLSQGLPRIGAYTVADSLAEQHLDRHIGSDKKISAIWKEETRVFRKNRLESEDLALLGADDRERVLCLRKQADQRVSEIKAAELVRLGHESLASVLLANSKVYLDLIEAGDAVFSR